MKIQWNGFTKLKFKGYIGIIVLLILILINVLYGEEKTQNMSILIVKIGNIENDVVEKLKNDLKKIFNQPVEIGKQLPEPHYAYNKIRNQYLSTAILNNLTKNKDFDAYERVLGIVDHDLYVPGLNFVFGEATTKGAVISLRRLRQEFYNLQENRNLFMRRVLTEAVHELGHTYGLPHCNNSKCVMYFSNSILDTDRKGTEFCTRCRLRIEEIRSLNKY